MEIFTAAIDERLNDHGYRFLDWAMPGTGLRNQVAVGEMLHVKAGWAPRLG